MEHTTFEYLQLILPFTVGIGAMILSYTTIQVSKRNLEKQLQTQKEISERQFKAQLASTINKEWVALVRGCTAKCIEKYVLIAELRHRYENMPEYKDVNYVTTPEYKEAMNEFRNNHIMLGLYLNFKESSGLEKQLQGLILKLWGIIAIGNDPKDSPHIIEEIQRVSHIIFESKSSLS